MEQIAKKNLKDVELRAPYSGIIAQKSIDTGSTVLPGVPAFKLMKIDWVNVNISVPENEVADVKMGADVTVTVAALGGKSFSGKITEKGIAADPLAHTYKALARIENRQGELLPGMVCVVNMGSRNNSQIVIPNSVVQVDYNGDHFVWLCCDGVAVKQTVSVGALSGNGVDDKSLVRSLADHSGCIVCLYLKYKPLSVHLNQLCLAGHLHADRCGCHMFYIHQRTDRSCSLFQFIRHTFVCRILHQGNHCRCRKYRKRTASHRLRCLIFCYCNGLCSCNSCFHL